jgi:hypothetical protein
MHRPDVSASINGVDNAIRISARRHPKGTRQDLHERHDHERLEDAVGANHRVTFGLVSTENDIATRARANTTLEKPDRKSIGKTGLHLTRQDS